MLIAALSFTTLLCPGGSEEAPPEDTSLEGQAEQAVDEAKAAVEGAAKEVVNEANKAVKEGADKAASEATKNMPNL